MTCPQNRSCGFCPFTWRRRQVESLARYITRPMPTDVVARSARWRAASSEPESSVPAEAGRPAGGVDVATPVSPIDHTTLADRFACVNSLCQYQAGTADH